MLFVFLDPVCYSQSRYENIKLKTIVLKRKLYQRNDRLNCDLHLIKIITPCYMYIVHITFSA